jgi:ABC-type multidrug transport system fused ATPase/permease subunit
LGELLSQGKGNLDAWWISLSTFVVLVSTLLLLTFMGEALRDAYDSRESRFDERRPFMSLLRYESLSISFGPGRREKFAVNQLDLDIGIGERLALVGESGSGKTLTALAPLRLEPEGAKVSGSIFWANRDGQSEVDLLSLPIQDIREIRAAR